MTAVSHPAYPPQRGGVRVRTWWARAWLRAVEEAAFRPEDVVAARTLARAGRLGRVVVDAGRLHALDDHDGSAVTVRLPVLSPEDAEAADETLRADPARARRLLGGHLELSLAEHLEEAGVELLPYADDLEPTCSCAAWVDPCPHALALLHQAAWLMDADPVVLWHLRGLPRPTLLAAIAAPGGPPGGDPGREAEADPALDAAEEAALRAARLVGLLDAGDEPPAALW